MTKRKQEQPHGGVGVQIEIGEVNELWTSVSVNKKVAQVSREIKASRCEYQKIALIWKENEIKMC